jgi:hypothetical protein
MCVCVCEGVTGPTQVCVCSVEYVQPAHAIYQHTHTYTLHSVLLQCLDVVCDLMRRREFDIEHFTHAYSASNSTQSSPQKKKHKHSSSSSSSSSSFPSSSDGTHPHGW